MTRAFDVVKHAYGCTDAEILRQTWAWLDAQVTVIRDRQRAERLWQLKIAVAATAQGEAGQEYINGLVEDLQASGPSALDRAAEAAEVEQTQAQARLDGLVRQVPAQRAQEAG